MNHEPRRPGRAREHTQRAARHAPDLASRPVVERFIQRRRNDGLQPKGVHKIARARVHAGRLLGGRPLASATEKDLMDLVTAFRDLMEESTVFRHVYILRRALRDLLDVDKLPKQLDRALYVKPPRERFEGRILSDAEFLQRTPEHTLGFSPFNLGGGLGGAGGDAFAGDCPSYQNSAQQSTIPGIRDAILLTLEPCEDGQKSCDPCDFVQNTLVDCDGLPCFPETSTLVACSFGFGPLATTSSPGNVRSLTTFFGA